MMQMALWKRLVTTISEKLISSTKKDTADMKCSPTINEVLIYGSNENEEHKKQVGLNNLYCILYMIVHAGKTIDISIPSLESVSLTNSLIQVKSKNNVQVRLVVYKSPDIYNLRCLSDNGVCVKVINSIVELEHEFIIIDGDGCDSVAILGSIDFEVKRVNCCRDTTILSSDSALIVPLRCEFERVWLSVDDTNINRFDDVDE